MERLPLRVSGSNAGTIFVHGAVGGVSAAIIFVSVRLWLD